YLAPYRAYNPQMGKWLSRDPIGQNDGINQYLYVWSAPVNFLDINGLKGTKNYMDPNDQAGKGAETWDLPNTSIIIAHGNKNGIYNTALPSHPAVSPEQALKDLASTGYKKGELIVLSCCSVGSGDFPQDLANLSGSPVVAPTEYFQAFPMMKDGK